MAACLFALGFSRGAAQPRATELFQQGLAALHQFEYEDANEAFIKAHEIDPAFVMAYWGEAMTYHQTLWGHEDLDAGRRALARLGPTPAARTAGEQQRSRGMSHRGMLARMEHGQGVVERHCRLGTPG